MNGSPRISVIIPTLNAAREINSLLHSLRTQSICPDEVLVIDSSSDDETETLVHKYEEVRFEVIRREDFDHGATRNAGFNLTSGEFVLFLTQDALPATDCYIENLIRPFSDQDVAAVSGRQLPKSNAKHFVQLVQEFNYPAISNLRSSADIETLGIRAFFCSDVCSAYRRSSLEKIGGVPKPCSTNEDMLAACRLLRAGFKVAYESEAAVYHSHNLSFKQQFLRNAAVGRFISEHSLELNVPSEIGEGGLLALSVLKRLFVEGEYGECASFLLDCVSRFAGNRFGRFCCG